MKTIAHMMLDDQGVSLAEEGFLVMLVALACLVALTALGTNVSNFFTSFATYVGSVAASL